MQKRARGNRAEELVAQYLAEQGMTVLDRNRTIRGGELDIVCTEKDTLVVVEVRSVDHIDDLHEYMTPQKMSHLFHTIEAYILAHNRQSLVRLDVVFVQQNSILEWYKDVTNT
ncbi:MAG: YraN family protein [bacterium]|nr:YraN family protein [bacterium]